LTKNYFRWMINSIMNKKIKIPLVALIGLPNAGKSTLVNRMTNGKLAIVAKEAHTTRDLNYGEVDWDGKYFRIVDTGGLVPDPEGPIQKEVQIKSWAAIKEADMLVWVIDRKQNIDTIHEKILQRIWRTKKPYIVVINKVDDPNLDKEQQEYAKLGGQGFINVSCNIGYGLGELCDLIIKTLEENGMGDNLAIKIDANFIEKVKLKKDRRLKNVEKKMDGTYIVRGVDGIFESFNAKEELEEQERIDNLVFDFYRVVFTDAVNETINILAKKHKLDIVQKKEIRKLYIAKYEHEISNIDFTAEVSKVVGSQVDFDTIKDMWINLVKEIPTTTNFIKHQRSLGKNIYYITNIGKSLSARRASPIYKFFDGGLASCEVGFKKPEIEIYDLLIEKYGIDPRKSVFIDDKIENVEAARLTGMKGIVYLDGVTDLQLELDRIEGREPFPPKILFLGKPNVGKSSLFNAMVGQDIQIVTDIAGTTLSVNETEIERKKKFTRKMMIKKEIIE
jgi:HAD superfamily hydrolase (TIGR01509 family)